MLCYECVCIIRCVIYSVHLVYGVYGVLLVLYVCVTCVIGILGICGEDTVYVLCVYSVCGVYMACMQRIL